MERKPKILVITGSTRAGRNGGKVGTWVYEQATQHDGIDVAHVDLAELNLPLSEEPNHPKTGQYTLAHTKKWAETIASADGFILVTPEYNHGYTAPVKNALDYLYKEWNNKPIAFVSYGAAASGSRSVEQLKQVVLELEMVPMHKQVMFHLDFSTGDPLSNLYGNAGAVQGMVQELATWAEQLAHVRKTQVAVG